MIESAPVARISKVSRLWNRARGCRIPVRIHYQIRRKNRCLIYSVDRIEPLD